MRDFIATVLSLAIIFATVWGAIAGFVWCVNQLSAVGVPAGILYFSAGIAFAFSYKNIGKWFANYCDAVWEKIAEWIVWR